MKTIATTEAIERRIGDLRERGVAADRATTIDLHWDYSTLTRNRQTSWNPRAGYRRLIRDGNFVLRQSRRLQRARAQHSYERYRCLTTFPEGFDDYSALREAWVNVQVGANQTEPYLIVQKDENPTDARTDITALARRFNQINLVIDMNAPLESLRALIRWALLQEKVDEIVLLNADFVGNEDKFALATALATENPNKFHLYGAYWCISRYDEMPLLATLLLCYGFKSVSFQKAKIPAYMFQHIRGRPQRSHERQLDDSVWVDDENMVYLRQHPQQCECFGKGRSLPPLLRSAGVEPCIYHHNLTSLSARYDLILTVEKELQRVLELEVFEPLVTQLGLRK